METDEKDLIWSVGFLEGEGCFSCAQSGSPMIAATQTATREPLDKLMKVFGGQINKFSNERLRSKGSNAKDYWRWNLYSVPAILAMIRLYPFMSSIRQAQIAIALEKILDNKNRNSKLVKTLSEKISEITKVS